MAVLPEGSIIILLLDQVVESTYHQRTNIYVHLMGMVVRDLDFRIKFSTHKEVDI